MGNTPLHTSSPLEYAKLGNTKPGQSHKSTSGDKKIVWKCLVLPGVDDTETFLEPTKALMVDDLPTFGYPTNPICNFLSGNSSDCSNLGAALMNNSSNSSILRIRISSLSSCWSSSSISCDFSSVDPASDWASLCEDCCA